MKITDKEITYFQYEKIKSSEVYRRYIIRDNFDMGIVFMGRGEIVLKISDMVAGKVVKRFILIKIEDE